VKRSGLAFGVMVAALVLVLGAPRPVPAQDIFYNYESNGRGTRMWVPPDASTVRGILIYGNGAGADYRAAVTAPWLRQFADIHNFALIGTSFWGNLSGTEINLWDAHLQALAAASHHPELVNAPWAPMGFSNGGQMSYGFNALRPEKTIAFITNKGCCYNTTVPSAAALKTPGILIAGELDTAERRNNIRGLFDTNRPRGALWSWIEQEDVAHAGLADAIVLPFMDEAIRLRYPANQSPTATSGVQLLPVNESNGWLVNQQTWKSGLTQIAEYGAYAGDKQKAGWLLDKNVAYLYRAFSTYDRPLRLDFHDVPLWENDAGPWAAGVGLEAPSTLRLDLNLAGVPGWTKVELFNYADSMLTLTPTISMPNLLTLDVPILRRGIYGLSALVTLADGTTLRTTNLLAYAAIPEPAAVVQSLMGLLGLALCWRTTGRRKTGSYAEKDWPMARRRIMDVL
jgi:dienelactone hydrolase